MNIVQISNLFNQVCLGINAQTAGRVGFYHYGWYSDINANISNNWTGDNALGRLVSCGSIYVPDSHYRGEGKERKGVAPL
jgi:hypothetical protein